MNFNVGGSQFDLDVTNVSMGMLDKAQRGEADSPADVIRIAVELARPDDRPLLSAMIPELSVAELRVLIEDVVAKTTAARAASTPASDEPKVPWLDRQVSVPLGYLIAVLSLFAYDLLHIYGVMPPSVGGALVLVYLVLMARLAVRNRFWRRK